MKAITIIKKLRYRYAQKYKHSINENLLHYSNWLQDEIAELTMKQANGAHAKEATAILPRVMPRFSDKKPPVNETVLFVWWHRNGFETSQKTLGFIDTANVLHLDFTPVGAKQPTFWCFLNEA